MAMKKKAATTKKSNTPAEILFVRGKNIDDVVSTMEGSMYVYHTLDDVIEGANAGDFDELPEENLVYRITITPIKKVARATTLLEDL